jgi:hypothetical protein
LHIVSPSSQLVVLLRHRSDLRCVFLMIIVI